MNYSHQAPLSKSISVVIPTHQRNASLKHLIDSLEKQNFESGGYEVLVVSNFPDPNLEAFIKNRKNITDIRILTANAKGANASRNLGIENSSGKIILLLDDDCTLNHPDYLTNIVEVHEKYQSIKIIGGGYELPNESTDEQLAYNIVAEGWQQLHRLGKNSSSRLVGGNVSYKAELFKSSSERFNEEIEYGGTEAEFHRRLESQGIAMIYLPKLKVTHNPEITESNLVEKARKQALATFKYDIDRGDNKLNMKSYQKSTQIWALKSSTNRGQYQKLLYLIDLYDWAYQKVIQEPEISLRNLKWSSYFWKRSKKKSIGRMVF